MPFYGTDTTDGETLIDHATHLTIIIFILGLYFLAVELYRWFRHGRSADADADLTVRLKAPPWRTLHVHLILFYLFIFAFMAALGGAAPDSEGALQPPGVKQIVQSSLVYYGLGVMLLLFIQQQLRLPWGRLLNSGRLSWWRAMGRGLREGVVILPPVMALSWGVHLTYEWLGHEGTSQEVFNWLDGSQTLATKLVLVFCTLILAPVSEELLFRGVLFTALLRRRSFGYAAFLSSFFFALVHLHAPSFIPLLVLSLGFSLSYYRSGNIMTSIVMHIFFNLTSLLLYFTGEG